MTNTERAHLALTHRLYVSGWSLSSILTRVRAGFDHSDVVLHWADGKPVGVLVITQERNAAQQRLVHIFVKKAYRGHGIAKTLLANMPADQLYAGPGITGSKTFWAKHGIQYQDISTF